MAGEARSAGGRGGGGLIPLAALAAAAVYATGGPVWDDHTLILDTLVPMVRSGALPDLWTRAVGGGEVGAGYYRPLSMTALALLGSLGIPAIHLAAAALHAGSTALLQRLLIGRPGWRAGALLFAVHPLASEALGWASALPDVLAVHLGLWSVLLARRSTAAAAALLLLGALSKETALLLLPAGLLADLAPARGWWSWLIGTASALGLRLAAGTGAAWAISGKLGLVPLALAWPVGSLLLPRPLTAVRDLLAAPGWALPLGLATAAGMAALARRDRLAWAGLALAIAAPALALPPTLTGYLAAERYAYPALVGAAFWLAAALPARRWTIAAGGALALLAAGLHIRRARAWTGDEALFGSATRSLPTSSYAWHFLGAARQRDGRPCEAAEAFEQAVLTGHPHPADREQALAMLLACGDPERALAWAESGPSQGLSLPYVLHWALAAARSTRCGTALEIATPIRGDLPPQAEVILEEIAALCPTSGTGQELGPEIPGLDQ